MNDLISVKTLTEAMTEWAKENFSLDDEYGHILQGMEKTLDLIEEQPTVDRWIPCSERLPEDRLNMFLVTLDNGDVCLGVLTEYGDWYTRMSEGELHYTTEHKVLAWMPMPEPYKAGDIDD